MKSGLDVDHLLFPKFNRNLFPFSKSYLEYFEPAHRLPNDLLSINYFVVHDFEAGVFCVFFIVLSSIPLPLHKLLQIIAHSVLHFEFVLFHFCDAFPLNTHMLHLVHAYFDGAAMLISLLLHHFCWCF